MRDKFKIKAKEANRSSSFIRPTQVKEQAVSFNFKNLSAKVDKFKYETKDGAYFTKLVHRLKDLGGMTRRELIFSQGTALRCHKIDFATDGTLTEKTLGVKIQNADENAYQFSLSANEHGRVHGYFIEDVFYIVWLDPEHQLYSSKR